MTDTVIPNLSLLAASMAAVAPFAAFIVILVFTRKRERLSAGLSIGAVSLSFLCALFLIIRHWGMETPLQHTVRWMQSGPITVPVGVLLDPLSLLMLLIVTGICLLVQIYSTGYMADDPGYSRYFAFMSLFAWAMTTMTLSPSMFQLYVFWELVGVSSYLLIGFWYEKFSASHAGKKAFVMTRLGDVAFLLGLLLVLVNLGNLAILDMNATAGENMPHMTLTISALLIFGGIVGKSAQFPLLTWLPDAMEGPTPVSALLHSATMVAAGVFLFARLFPFFSLSPQAMSIFLAIGTVSMLLASTMAMVSRDMKQVWAFSTISQLGFMIMGLSAGSYVAGVFHLTTHAAFKALLFLCSGVFIHAYHTNDMFKIGQAGGRRMKIPMACMVIAGAALSGVPPFSGFFSKELIMGALAGLKNPAWLIAGLAGVFLTAYYTFRLIFIVLFPESIEESTPEAENGIHETRRHENPKAMLWPLVILAVITIVLGFFEHSVSNFLSRSVPAPATGENPFPWLEHTALFLVAAGVLLAWLEFGMPWAPKIGFAERIPQVYALFSRRWYIDDFYRRFLDTVIYRMLSDTMATNDNKVIDGGIEGLSSGVVGSGRLLSALHSGMIQYRLMAIFAVMIFIGLYLFLG